MDPVELSADGVTLRIPDERDINDIVIACNDPDMVRFTTVPAPYSEQHARDFVAVHAAEGWQRGDVPVFAITETGIDRFSGAIDLRLSPAIGAEIGYSVAPWARGRGVGATAVRLVCCWGFEVLRLPRIEWQADVGNIASRRLAESVGFVVEGTCRKRLLQRGERVDGWIGSLLPGELRYGRYG